MEKKSQTSSAGSGAQSGSGQETDSGRPSIREELEERNKELFELRHAHNKLKKALQDRSVELNHGLRRAEHSEAEVCILLLCCIKTMLFESLKGLVQLTNQ